MANKFKYMRRVFSGKDTPAIGMDQGKALLYRGDGVRSAFNIFYDSSMMARDGQAIEGTYAGGVNTGVSLSIAEVIGEGTNLRAELYG